MVSALIAGVLSFYASGHPDGLTFVAQSLRLRRTPGAALRPRAHRWRADTVSGVSDARLSGGLAGLIGLAVVGLLMAGLVLLLRRRAPRSED